MTAHEEVRRRLGLDGSFRPLLEELAALEPEPGAARLPDPAETPALLARLGFSELDAGEAAVVLPEIVREPALRWLLERCSQQLAGNLGNPSSEPASWPDLPPHLGAAGRWFYLAVFLAALPAVRRFHTERGVPADVSWATLADLGLKAARSRDLRRVGGLDQQGWFRWHFGGILYALGRLQFNLGTEDGAAGGLAPGMPVLGVHIPETGPLTPAACDASLRRARPFFARHLGVDCQVATCTSWLLDPQLAEYLPAAANIIRFQRRFHLLPQPDPGRDVGDRDILEFVFHRTDPDLDALPQRTTLQRAVVTRLRGGGHWHVRSGWLELEA